MRCILTLLLVALSATAVFANSFLDESIEFATAEEREKIMTQAIEEVKTHFKAREDSLKNRVETQNEKDGKYTSSQLMSKFFKKASKDAKMQGKARQMYEQVIHKTERKLSELKRAKVAKLQGTEARAESLAQMLFHKPGSLLTKEEIARAWEVASELPLIRKIPSCNFPTVNQFRTIDGTCNNLLKPLAGAAGTAFRRLTPPVYEDGVSSLRGSIQSQNKLLSISPFVPPNPSARFISETVIQNVTQDEIPFTHLLMQWGQFLDHDMDLGPELEEECKECKFTDICQPIRVPDLDRSFGIGTPNNGTCLPLRRSVPIFEPVKPLSFSPREQLNDITSFIDASMVYGSRLEQSFKVRAFKGGLLLEGIRFPGKQPSLPIDKFKFVQCLNRMDCFLCGEIRCNEQFSLSIMHTLWLREHNRCARELARINPFWGDERLFQECRRIIGALIQKITFQDYLPKVLGPEAFKIFIGPYLGYNPLVDPSIPNSFATAAYRYGHSLVRSFFDRLDENYLPLPIGPLKLVDAFFSPDQFRKSLGTDPIMRGWVSVNSRRMDEFLNSILTSRLFETPLTPGFDLASLNIQRGRDHGLSPYLIFRNFCFEKFGLSSEFENDLTLVRFLKLYGSLDTLDLWIAGLAEDRLPKSLLGATFSCIFGLTFRNVRAGDRFFWLKPGVFTPAQRKSIRSDSIARVICDNSDNIKAIQPDAFLSNQTRVDCGKLGRVDLSLFKENVCYFRGMFGKRNIPGQMSVFSRSTEPEFVFSSFREPPSSENEFECMQIQCPTESVPTEVMIFSTVDLLSSTRLIPNKLLPPSTTGFGMPGVYRAMWPRSAFGTGNGVFLSRESCERSSKIALSLDFLSSGPNFEEQFLAKMAAETEEQEEELTDEMKEMKKRLLAFDKANMKLPEEMMKILQSKNANIELESLSTAENSETKVTEEADIESLFNDLEKAMKDLN